MINGSVEEDSIVCSEELQPGIFCCSSIINPSTPFIKILNTTNNSALIANNHKFNILPLNTFNIFNTTNATTQQSRIQNLLTELPLHNTDKSITDLLIPLCSEYNDIFCLKNDQLTHNNFYEQEISVTDESPIYIKNYRTPHSQSKEVEEQVEKLLEKQIVRNSRSPYNSPILLVPKKSVDGNKTWRLVVDFRQLNKKVLADKFPLPRIEDILDNLGKAKYFSTLDLMSGFHQIPLSEESKKYTAFSTPLGHFEYERLPFGLNISPNSFQRMMTLALSGLSPECAFLYIDDIIVVGRSPQNHIHNLSAVFEKLRKCNLKLNPAKCNFFKHEVTFLGHQVTKDGISPDPSKFNIIKNYPTPQNADDARRFVAFCNYYRRFIPNFAQVTQPLNNLTKKNTKFVWTPNCQQSFEALKQQLISPHILKCPDFSKTFYLMTDASNLACGAVLTQQHNDIDMPVAFASKSFTKGEANKSTIEKELTAIHWAITYFKPYLYGHRFVVKTDHRPLVYLFSMKDPSSKLTRMRMDLEEFDFSIEYVKGKENVLSDALSRIQIDINDIINIKDINVITRSMTSKARDTQHLPVQISKSDQLHVYEALNNTEAFGLKKIFFSYNEPKTNLLLNITNKKYKKKITHELSNNMLNREEQITTLTEVFNIIDRNFDKLRLASPDIPLKFALAHNDLIFNHVNIQVFKDIGNKLIKNGSIIIYERPKTLTDVKEIDNVLKFYHLTPSSGHLGINRLYRKIKSFYTWQNMKKVITAYVRSCTDCAKSKSFVTTPTHSVVTSTPEKPFDVLSIDTVGPFSLSEKGNRYAISVQCDLSKFIILIPIPDKSSSTVAKAIFDHCFSIFGPVAKVKSDQGTEYKGVFDEICKLLRVSHICGTAYHPQTIGAVERSHRCLNEFLRTYANEAKDNWDTWLPYFSLSFNTVPSEEHGYTPFELVFGKSCRNVLETMGRIDPVYNYDSYLAELKFKLQTAHKLTSAAITKAKEKRTDKLNSGVISPSIEVGDQVYLKNENRHKLEPVNSGPFIVKQIDKSNATIITSPGAHQTVHRSRLIKFKSSC